eukprot:647500-Hanusia_phi.AAC.4
MSPAVKPEVGSRAQFLNVSTIEQGALRVAPILCRAMFAGLISLMACETDSVVLLLLLGLYLTIGPVLNYNKIESDQRDMVDQEQRMCRHVPHSDQPDMDDVLQTALSLGAPSSAVSLETWKKARGKLPDPRFLDYDSFLQVGAWIPRVGL